MTKPLGRQQPPDWNHIVQYPLEALSAVPQSDDPNDTVDLRPSYVPVAIGINWYDNFDRPVEKDGAYWIGLDHIGSIRGGHCVCLEPWPDPSQKGEEEDNKSWWAFYNQGQEGSCEGHGHSRMASLLFRKRFDAVWLYNEAQKIDGIQGNHEGTTNRAALEVLRTQGHRVAHGKVTTDLEKSDKVNPAYGCSTYRWAQGVGAIAQSLGIPPGIQYVTLLNSWGEEYPEKVRMPFNVLERLVNEAGEAGVITER